MYKFNDYLKVYYSSQDINKELDNIVDTERFCYKDKNGSNIEISYVPLSTSTSHNKRYLRLYCSITDCYMYLTLDEFKAIVNCGKEILGE